MNKSCPCALPNHYRECWREAAGTTEFRHIARRRFRGGRRVVCSLCGLSFEAEPSNFQAVDLRVHTDISYHSLSAKSRRTGMTAKAVKGRANIRQTLRLPGESTLFPASPNRRSKAVALRKNAVLSSTRKSVSSVARGGKPCGISRSGPPRRSGKAADLKRPRAAHSGSAHLWTYREGFILTHSLRGVVLRTP